MSERTADKLEITAFPCSGQFQTNCYLVRPAMKLCGSGPRPCWIIDPGMEVGDVLRAVRLEGLAVEAIVLTHGHFDHVAGVPEVRSAVPAAPIWISRAEADALQSPQMNGSAMFGVPLRLAEKPDRLIDDGRSLSLGPLAFESIVIPGHSPGGACYYCSSSGDLFSGDVLFAGSIGRSDTFGGDGGALVRGIRRRLLTLPPATRVWPGHGPATTIAAESAANPWLIGTVT